MMNRRAGTLVAVKRPGGPPKLPRSLADLFCLIAATSNACARNITDAAMRTRPATRRVLTDAILIGVGALGVVDHEDVHAVARRFELEPELIPKGLENGRSIRPRRGVDAQIVRNPLDLPVEFPGEAGVIDDDAIDAGAREADQQIVERHRTRLEMAR